MAGHCRRFLHLRARKGKRETGAPSTLSRSETSGRISPEKWLGWEQ